MKFVHTTILVKNMEESLKFYEEIVGLKVVRKFSTPTGEIAFLGDGETKLELIYNKQAKEISYGEHISIGFAVDNVEEKMKVVMDKGIELKSKIIQPNPTTKFFFVSDPDGLRVQFIQ